MWAQKKRRAGEVGGKGPVAFSNPLQLEKGGWGGQVTFTKKKNEHS